jgi:hypothetical protein
MLDRMQMSDRRSGDDAVDIASDKRGVNATHPHSFAARLFMQGTERRWRAAFLVGVFGSILFLSVFTACSEIVPPSRPGRLMSAPATRRADMAVDWYSCSMDLAYPDYGWTCVYVGCTGSCSDYPSIPTFADPGGEWNPCDSPSTCLYPTGTGSYPATYDTKTDTTNFRSAFCTTVTCTIGPISATERRFALSALDLVNTTDTLCTKLKTYATTQINATPARIFTWDVMDHNWWGLTYYNATGIGPDYNATLLLQDSVLLNLHTQKENARTLIHESYHAFARSSDDIVAESLAVNVCVL